MRTSLSLPLVLLVLLAACDPEPDAAAPSSATAEPSKAQALVDRAIAAHGGDRYDAFELEFDFRDRHFVVYRNDGVFRYERTFSDSLDTDELHTVRDVLTNDGLYREVDGQRVELDEETYDSALSGTNSVVYFALLPYGLNDAAAQKRYLGEATIDGEPYEEVEVTFTPEGGGVDYEDRFVYWFHRDRHTMDYLAYSFHVNEGGTRFREATNVRTIEGIRFADYHNYSSPALPEPDTPIERFDELMAQDSLELISDIVLTNIEVRPVDEDA